MAHSVGEQAARAVKNSERKKPEEMRTPEQIIKSIRGNLAAHLAVTPGDTNFLLGAFDAEKAFSHKLAEEAMALKVQIADLQVQLANAAELPVDQGGEA